MTLEVSSNSPILSVKKDTEGYLKWLEGTRVFSLKKLFQPTKSSFLPSTDTKDPNTPLHAIAREQESQANP